MKKKQIYYSSENEEVVNFNTKKLSIDESYKYKSNNPFYKFFSWFSYHFLATPFAFITFKLFKPIKFHNRKLLKPYKKSGYFIYANHTNQFADGFCPGLICFPQKPHILVHPDNISIPFLGKFLKMWGAIPIPNNIKATKNFYSAIENVLNSNNPIIIYPEAHLWPYYTKIRNFPATSFRYPIKYNKPVFTFTTVYKKKKFKNKPKIEIYVDGPFFINKNIPEKIAQLELRNVVFNTLTNRSTLSNYEYIKYIKKEK